MKSNFLFSLVCGLCLCFRSRLADFQHNCQPSPLSASGCIRESRAMCLKAYAGLIGEMKVRNGRGDWRKEINKRQNSDIWPFVSLTGSTVWLGRQCLTCYSGVGIVTIKVCKVAHLIKLQFSCLNNQAPSWLPTTWATAAQKCPSGAHVTGVGTNGRVVSVSCICSATTYVCVSKAPDSVGHKVPSELHIHSE